MFAATLAAIDRAEQATMKSATRYLETHMVRDLAVATGGRYRRVRVDDRTLDIEVHAPEKGDWVPVESLSQGTVDLVYLVARLGLVRLVTGDRRPPLVFDDPFVTLDDARATRAIGLLRLIASDFQVIYLTTSPRYDDAADAVVVLDGPTTVDAAADGLPTNGAVVARRRRPNAGRHRSDSAAERARRGRVGHRPPRPLLRRRVGLRRLRWRAADPANGAVRGRPDLAVRRARARADPGGRPRRDHAGAADLGWSVLAGIAGGIGISALYQGLAVGRMGIVAPVTGVMAAVIPVAAGIVLEGVPPPLVLVGIALAIVAVVLVSRVSDAAGGRSGLELALLAGVGIGAMSVCIAQIGDGHVFGPLVVIRSTQALLIVAVVLVTRSAWRVDRRLIPAIAGVGVLDMAGNGAFILAVQTGALAVAAVLSSLYPVTTVILATVVLRERVTRSHAVGIALAAAAVGCIAAGSAS